MRHVYAVYDESEETHRSGQTRSGFSRPPAQTERGCTWRNESGQFYAGFQMVSWKLPKWTAMLALEQLGARDMTIEKRRAT